MFDQLSHGARRAVIGAQEHSRRLGHPYIGTEHLLLGVLDDERDSASAVLARLDVAPDATRAAVEARVGHGGGVPSGHIPFTFGAKRVLEASLDEARGLGQDTIRTEHLLLGLIQEPDSLAAAVLAEEGVDLARARDAAASIDGDGSGS